MKKLMKLLFDTCNEIYIEKKEVMSHIALNGVASHSGRSRTTQTRSMLLKLEVSAGPMGHFADMKTLPFYK